MEKPTYKLVGAPCGHHGQYSFYKAIRCTGVAGGQDKVLVIGDFFFVKLWQDSELVSIGELQLLWSDRVSDQTLVSLRLYFLPENTPDGRGAHGQDEVLAINDKVVIRVEDLMSWMCRGDEWHRGLKAVWRGAAPPEPPEPSHAPLHASRLDFSDVEKEKVALEEAEVPGVVVFSYPRYCRYRALLRRLEGVGHGLLRDSLVCALGGYAAPTTNTRILYCKDTFEYPELEGHEFVCNHLAPRLKGRPRGRRRRRARSHSPSPERSPSRTASECSISSEKTEMVTPPRASLRNGSGSNSVEERAADKAFMSQLRTFHRDHSTQLKMAHNLKELSLRALYQSVVRGGGYERVCRDKGWRALHGALQGRPASPSQATLTRRHYERLLLPFEKYERRNGSKWWKLPKLQNGTSTEPESPKQDRKKHIDTTPIATIDISDSPIREIIEKDDKPIPRLRTPSPDHKQEIINLNSSGSDIVKRDEDELPPTHAYDPSNLLTDDTKEFKQAADLNQEFLDSLPKHEPPKDEKPSEPPIKISVKPVEKLIEKPACFMENQSLLASKLLGVEKIPGLTEYLQKQSLTDLSTSLLEIAAKQNAETQSSILAEIASKQSFSEVSNSLLAEIAAKQSLGDTGAGFFRELAQKQTLGEINTSFLAEIAKAQQDLLASSSALSSLTGLSDKLVNYATLAAAGLANGQLPNGTVISVQQGTDKSKSGDTSGSASPVSRRPAAARSSLRSVRVKPTRSAAGAAAPNTPSATPLRPDSASCSPPVTSSVTPAPPQPTLTNFGINYMPPSALHKHLQPAALHNQVTSTNQLDAHSDDEIIEVPYKPKTPEIIDLDEYESPDSPQAVKKKKLDILKERGLEVTAVTNDWPTPAPGGQPTATPTLAATILQPNPMLLNPAVQQQIMTQAQFFQMYNTIMPQGYTNGLTPPKVIQGKSIYGSPGPEKTVYGNPKDPFMPPPHMLQGAPPLKQPRCLLAEPRPASGPDILDLSSKQEAVQKPAVEIVRIPSVPSPSKPVSSTPPHNLSKSYSLIDGKAVVGSNLEITLVRPRTPQATSPPKTPRPRQKRSSTGQFMSNKTSPSSRESPNYSKAYISPSGIQTSIPTSTSRLVQDMYKSNERAKQATNIVIPNYQMSNSSRDSDVSPTSSTSSRDGNSMVALTSSLLQGGGGSMLQNVSKGSNLAQFVEMQSKNPAQNLAQFVEMQAKSPAQNLAQFMDPSMYMSALYSSLAGQLTPGMPDQHQLAMYQNLISSRLMRNYPGLLNMSSVTSTPTTKN